MKQFNWKTEPLTFMDIKPTDRQQIMVSNTDYLEICSNCDKLTRKYWMIGSRCRPCIRKENIRFNELHVDNLPEDYKEISNCFNEHMVLDRAQLEQLKEWCNFLGRTPTGKVPSNNLKHIAEQNLGFYVSNADMKVVMRSLGFKVKNSDEKNPWYNVSKSSFVEIKLPYGHFVMRNKKWQMLIEDKHRFQSR